MPSVSVMDSAFSAKCDGATDDTAAIQNTLNVAAAGEGVVQIPPSKVCFSATGITIGQLKATQAATWCGLDASV